MAFPGFPGQIFPETNPFWLVVTGTWLDYGFPFSWECHHPK